ncbi:MAG TPA: DMT family transporter [Candidatus Limnocylindria bacterium]|jgi:drug/metabolite transporter (DMT)-like permease|nr:DMT family transporter [Candidatus Limnocylindria bacterium]
MPRSFVTPLAAFCVALAWSGGWIAGKLGVTSAPPLEFSAVRFIIAAAVLGALALATRTPIGSGGLVPIILSAVFGYLGYNAFVFVGLTMAPASDAALIVPTTIPVLTAIAASFLGERLGSTKIAGFVLASIGAALVIAAGQNGGELSGQRLLGDLLMLAGAVCWAIYTALGTLTLRTRSPLAVVTLAAPIGAVLLLPFGFLEQGYRDVGGWSASVWIDAVYLALVVTVGSFTLFYWVVRRVGAGIAAMSSYFVPILTLAMAVVFLGDRPQPLQLVGGVVILAGVRVATLRISVEQPLPEGLA